VSVHLGHCDWFVGCLSRSDLVLASVPFSPRSSRFSHDPRLVAALTNRVRRRSAFCWRALGDPDSIFRIRRVFAAILSILKHWESGMMIAFVSVL
jgi:hypothetical protein